MAILYPDEALQIQFRFFFFVHNTAHEERVLANKRIRAIGRRGRKYDGGIAQCRKTVQSIAETLSLSRYHDAT